jgi:hypothetical protein
MVTTTTTSIIPTTTTTIVEEWIPCKADINGDGFVDELDEEILYEEFGRTKCRKRGRKKCRADFNRDRVVDEKDEEIFLAELGREDCNDVPLLLYLFQEIIKNWKKKAGERRYGND